MDEIKIKYWSPHGRQEESKYRCNDERIDFIMRAAKRIDLTNLQHCPMLMTLNLANNMLEEIDLSPLESNSALKELRLENNHLTSIDLWPFAGCQSLEKINLTNNRLQFLDLTPVLAVTQVHLDSSVVISADNIHRYLFTTKELGERFQLIRPDRVPWTAPPVLMWTNYETLATRMEWSEMKKRILAVLEQVPPEKWYHIQRGLLIGLGMGELAGYDGDPSNLLKTTHDYMNYHQARRAIFDRTVDLLEQQINDGGPTLFLETEAMEKTSASKLIGRIITARQLEIENAVVLKRASISVMNSLWLTHYGYCILNALDVGMRHFGADNKVLKSFDELGFPLKIKEVESLDNTPIEYPMNVTESMKDFVYNQIENAYM